MSAVLGLDAVSRMAARFGGRLRDVTFVRETVAGPNPSDPTGPPLSTSASYAAQGFAFGYGERFVDSEHIKKGDYQVTILLGTIVAVADDAITAELDLGTLGTGALDTVVRALAEGVAGNAIAVELVSGLAASVVEIGTLVKITIVDGVTAVADVEALLATSTLLEVATPGTGATVLVSADAFSATALAGGAAPSSAQSGVVPQPGDSITCAPPNSTTPKTGRVVGVGPMTAAAVTVHVLGDGA